MQLEIVKLFQNVSQHSLQQIQDPRRRLINLCFTSLIEEDKIHNTAHQTRDQLYETVWYVADIEPEFVLMTAYYTRNELDLRSTTNFILAFANEYQSTRPFCKKYFNHCVKSPNDLIEIAEFSQLLRFYFNSQYIGEGDQYIRLVQIPKNIRSQLVFSKCLQKCIKKKFQQFTTQQLGKYCSDSRKRRIIYNYNEFENSKLKQQRCINRILKREQKEKEYQKLNKKQKKIQNKEIRQKTIKKEKKLLNHFVLRYQPEQQSKLLKYLTMQDLIRFCHISEPKMHVMQLMRLRYPQNQDEFNKLFKPINDAIQFDPQMAGKKMKIPTPLTWERALSQGTEKKGVIWNRLIQENALPFMACVRNLKNISASSITQESHELLLSRITNRKIIAKCKLSPLQIYKANQELNKMKNELERIYSKKDKQDNYFHLGQKINLQYFNDYSRAMELILHETIISLDTISGRSLILVSKEGLNDQNRTKIENALILSQILRVKCEYSQFYLYSGPTSNRNHYIKVNFGQENLFESVEYCLNQFQNINQTGDQFGQVIYEQLLEPKISVDNIIVISTMNQDQTFRQQNFTFEQLIYQYTQTVNKNTNWYFIDINGQQKELKLQNSITEKLFYLPGINENIIKMITCSNSDPLNSVYQYSKSLANEGKQQMKQKQMELI